MLDKVLPVCGALMWATFHTLGSVFMGFLLAPPRRGNLIEVMPSEMQGMALYVVGIFFIVQVVARLDGWISRERPRYVSLEVFFCGAVPAVAWAFFHIRPIETILFLFSASVTSAYLDFSKFVPVKQEG